MKLCGAVVRQETLFFQFCKFETGPEQEPLLLTTPVSIHFFGQTFEKVYDGLVNFPSFQDVETSLKGLLDDIKSKKELTEMKIGEPLTRLIEKCSEWVDSGGRRPDFISDYRDIVDKEKELTPNRQKYLKFMTAQIIALIDYDSKGKLCYCGEMPSISQESSSKQLFYGCGIWYHDKENACKFGKNLHLSY